MSKVEELRDKVMVNCGVIDPWYGDPVAMAVDSLIAAVEAQGIEKGKAEGSERLREYTEKYLEEGIRRCNAARAQGRAEGAEAFRQQILHSEGTMPETYSGFDVYVVLADTLDKPAVLKPVEGEIGK